MTPKEKAEELYNKMYNFNMLEGSYQMSREVSKWSALIAVETVILNCYEEEEYYWQEVKQEIEKL